MWSMERSSHSSFFDANGGGAQNSCSVLWRVQLDEVQAGARHGNPDAGPYVDSDSFWQMVHDDELVFSRRSHSDCRRRIEDAQAT